MTEFKKAIIIGVVIGVGIIVALQKWDLLFYSVIFLCPFMHLFMHNGHGGHAGHDRNNDHGNHKNQSNHDKDKSSNKPHRGCH